VRPTNRIAPGMNDEQRTKNLALGANGKRLSYKQPAGTRAN